MAELIHHVDWTDQLDLMICSRVLTLNWDRTKRSMPKVD